MTAPQVSVVIPTRNRPDRLLRTLGTVLAQRDTTIEVVVVDDASAGERTLAVLGNLPSPVRVVRHEERRGLAEARNTGIASARGEWVAFLDDDDLWSPDKLRRQRDAAADDGAGWAVCDAILLYESPTRVYPGPPLPTPDALLDWVLAGHPLPAGASNVVADTGLLRDLGGFDVNLAHLADADMWIRLAGAGPPAMCPEALVAYVHHGTNMHWDPDVEGMLAELRYLDAKHATLRAAHGVLLRDAPVVEWIAGNQLRAGRRWAASRVHLRHGLRHRDGPSIRRAIAALVKPAAAIRGGGDPIAVPEWLVPILRTSGPEQ